MSKIRGFNKQKVTQLAALFLVAGIGTYALVSSHASTPYTAVESESGTLSGAATEESDVNASGGKYVQFGSISSGSTGYTGTCDKIISPSTADGYVASNEKDMNPGQTLCLTSGDYGSLTTSSPCTGSGNDELAGCNINIWTQSGSSGNPIIVTSAPGQTATIQGGMEFRASYLTLEYMNIDVSNTISEGNTGADPDPPCTAANKAQAIEFADGYTSNDDTLQYNNIYESIAAEREILIFVGPTGGANGLQIKNNKLSDAGSCGQTQHIIYDDQGSNNNIYDNWFWDDPYGYAVQLYPHTGTTKLYSNVFDDTLDGIVDATDVGGNQTYKNVAINMVSSNSNGYSGGAFLDCYGGSTGTPDTITNNAIWNDPAGFGCSGGETGVTISGSLTLNADPFINSAAHNYSLGTNSSATQLSGYGLWNGAGPPTPDPAP
jgi:hypothetical protein